jgi:hypothetical protein
MKLAEKLDQQLLRAAAEQAELRWVPELTWDYFVLHPIQAFYY